MEHRKRIMEEKKGGGGKQGAWHAQPREFVIQQYLTTRKVREMGIVTWIYTVINVVPLVLCTSLSPKTSPDVVCLDFSHQACDGKPTTGQLCQRKVRNQRCCDMRNYNPFVHI